MARVRIVVAIVLLLGAALVVRSRMATPRSQAPAAPPAPALPVAAPADAKAPDRPPTRAHDEPRARAAPPEPHARSDGQHVEAADQDAEVPLLADDEQRRAAGMTRTAVVRALAQADRGALRMLLGAVEARADDQLLSFADVDALEAALACLDAREGARAKALATIAARPSSFDLEVRSACATAP